MEAQKTSSSKNYDVPKLCKIVSEIILHSHFILNVRLVVKF